MMMTFDDNPNPENGWKIIFKGLYSPFESKYT
jgi:hypothetical protein